jgi:hypothetical protein
MIRAVLIAAATVAGFVGCGAKPDAPGASSAPKDSGSLRSVQNSEKPEITADRISKDVVGRALVVPEVSGAGPNDKWTFEADEYRRIDILDRRPTAAGLDLLVFMLTRSRPGEGDVQVSGQLRLRYEWKGKQWVLRSIENVSFRYSVGVST